MSEMFRDFENLFLTTETGKTKLCLNKGKINIELFRTKLTKH